MDPYEHIYDGGDGDDATTLVLLHGTGGDAAHFMRLGRVAAPGAALIALEGNVDEQGLARFYRRVSADIPDFEDLEKRSRDLAAFLTDALTRHGRDPAQAVGVGYSNGANILANLLFNQPRVLAGYALMHPSILYRPCSNKAIAGRKVLITAGAEDAVAPESEARKLRAWLQKQGASVDLMVHDGDQELREEEADRLKAWLADFRAAHACTAMADSV
ncbi:alpha/beta hydrolase [Breoghania sp. JC706]|uniref:alpha/beta hydrolase n=1 Tax=Breoghania sp. JC706 TaxID=3117732 RepID=UPI00300A901D